MRATQDHCRACTVEVYACLVNIADDNLRSREDEPLVIADITAFPSFEFRILPHLLDLGLTLTDFCQVFLDAAFKIRQFLLPILEYKINHNYPTLLIL